MRRCFAWVLLVFACDAGEVSSAAPEPTDVPVPSSLVDETVVAPHAEPKVEPLPKHRRPLRDVDCVYLQPLGQVSDETTEVVHEALAATYGVELRVGPRRALPVDAFYRPRKRYRAEKLLDHLDRWLPVDCDRIVGITARDISTTKGKHEDWGILGLGRVPGKSCVVSSFRLHKQLGRVPADERLARVAIHELGHTLGLPHCPNHGCLMEDARGTVVTIDDETHLCVRCRRQLDWRGPPPPERPSFD